MIGVIRALKADMYKNYIQCEIVFEGDFTFDEYNKLVKTFEENMKFEQRGYKMTQKGRFIRFEPKTELGEF
ncbi:MAG: hypothetical protein ACTSQ8_07775 [Candidatus Helarchaeota archaeon]